MINKLLDQIKIHCYHQVSHTNQNTEVAEGNSEVNKFLFHVNAVTKKYARTKLQKKHDNLHHPRTKVVAHEIRGLGLNIPNYKAIYTR